MSTDDVPLGINTALGAVVATLAVVIVGASPLPPPAGVAALGLAVGLFALATGDVGAGLVTALLALVLRDGFVENRFGELSWHASDLAAVLVLVAAALVGAGLGTLRRRRRHGRRFAAVERWANATHVDVRPDQPSRPARTRSVAR